MLIDWDLFDLMFPTYYRYKVPMWSDWKEDDEKGILNIVIPGYKKEDFSLSIEDYSLQLEIKREKKPLTYSILGWYPSKDYNIEDATAEYEAGILKITIPKLSKPKKKLKKIEIS